MHKLNVAVLAGGRSSEHDISRLSAAAVIDALDHSRYEPVAVLIERSGDWRLTSPGKLALNSDRPSSHVETQSIDADQPSDAARTTTLTAQVRHETRPATVTSPSTALRGVDVIFPVLHGPFGEDGTMQGLLETVGIPYVGSGVLASAVGMDKAVFKSVLRDAGIPVAGGDVLHAKRCDRDAYAAEAPTRLGLPLFVKPARLGSSIGISRATTAAELRAALDTAFAHDDKVLVEPEVRGIEIECGVLGNDDPIVSVPGRIHMGTGQDWYDFDAKYCDEGVQLEIPAQLPDDVTERVQQTALRVFQAIDCAGLARVDCFVTESGDVVVNEVNTMPGFTARSAYAQLFAATGVPYAEVVDRLIQLAIDRHRERSTLAH